MTSNKTSKLKDFYSNNPWKGRVLIFIATLLLLLVIIRLILTPSIIYGANSWFKEQGIDSSIEDVKIGLFNGAVSLVNAKGSRDKQTIFNIGLIELHWRWSPLSNKIIEVTEVVLDQLSLNIEKYQDKIIVSGITIPLNAEEDIKDNNDLNADAPLQENNWAAALGLVSLTNLNVCYLQHDTTLEKISDASRIYDYCIDLKEITWNGTVGYGVNASLKDKPDIPLSSTGDFALNGLTIRDNKLNKILLASKTNTLSKVKIAGLNNIKIDSLEMFGLSALERDDKQHIDTLRFSQLSIKDISLVSLNQLTLGNIELNEAGLYLVKNNKDDWEHQPWIPTSNAPSQSAPKIIAPTNKNTSFKLAIHNIAINTPDLCYLQKNTTQYYCFTAQTLNWKGDITFDEALKTKGDAAILQAKIRNHSLNRNLLTVNSIRINQLNISDLNDVSLSKFTIEKMNALQRSKKDSDSTASFKKLLISNIGYKKDQVIIDNIDLTGIASHVSKNKDGNWEHSKWTENDKVDVKPDKKDSKNNTPDNIKQKPLLLSIKKLSISSDNKILFTDNSTAPETIAGIKKLTFDLSKLNANKPNTDSLFKLFAQTTRHSTIDLEGTFRPYAEKVAINADGKLKGFDLRAASPTAEKTIGHTIKSGQLDADIELRATDGILDSNIALSLYHFNLKADSKDDAKALDDLFGMPINQSLILLRDKDDSIHLDIPITGDVNNPDFSPMSAIIKATTKATTVTLITFYTPYGLIYAGGNVLLDIATALDFDPLLFEAGSSEMTEKHKEELTNLSKLLTEKPQVHLTLCGVTNVHDLQALFPDTKNPSEKIKISLSEKQNIELNKLAKNRQVKIKKYLIGDHSIEHGRLILCAPEFNAKDDAISGVEINI